MSFNMLPEVDSKGLKNFPCFSGEGSHLIFGVAGAFEKSSKEMLDNVLATVGNNEMLKTMIDSINIVSVDSPEIMNGWKNSIDADTSAITFIGDVNGEFTRKMGMSTVFADGSTRSWFFCAMVSDGFFDVWSPVRGFRDGLEVSSFLSIERPRSNDIFKTCRSFHNEIRDLIDELIEEEEMKSVAGK
ncbi:hypothetical protein PQZ07_00380 [bacterium]|nr:hypothetical protein [bacterium]